MFQKGPKNATFFDPLAQVVIVAGGNPGFDVVEIYNVQSREWSTGKAILAYLVSIKTPS